MKYFTIFYFLLVGAVSHGQIFVKGSVRVGKEPLPFAHVHLKNSGIGVCSDKNGKFQIKIPKNKNVILVASFTGFFSQEKSLVADADCNVDFTLSAQMDLLDKVTITGTRTSKRQTQNAVIVNVISSAALENVQACNLSEGLRFQTGLRVEMDCQTCNYSQLRMNGLAGGYSQILINGRSIFSPLTGLYGLEQIPTNMIERIEIVRGGGSALYGSSAIGGTVNVLTQTPKKNTYQIGYTYQNTKNTNDQIVLGNATVVNENQNAGASFFVNNRNRQMYDANGDHFSELPRLKNKSFGVHLFYLPVQEQKLEVDFNKINEYRYGGEMVDKPPHFARQSEERIHDVYTANADYDITFNNGQSHLTSYIAGQYTDREHYTGILPEAKTALQKHYQNPPYGHSTTTTFQVGAQFNHNIQRFLKGTTTLTLGSEYVQDKVFDQIKTYDYKIEQFTQTIGFFLQNDWQVSNSLSLLMGLRLDKHNRIKNFITSPRISLLYKPFKNTQLRATWGMGFRAPQSFDTDLHIAFAGGGVSRISLANDLREERSHSYSLSINYDKPTEHYIYGCTLEGFYTYLKDAFYLKPLSEDRHGQRFEKSNGQGATVQGLTLETRVNYEGIIQLETGCTYQKSLYDTAIENAAEVPPKKEFLRTPNLYGYATIGCQLSDHFKTSLHYLYTGSMPILHLAGGDGITKNTYVTSKPFSELGCKANYTFEVNAFSLGFSAGIKNIFDSYQSDFDKGKNRDSNYIYGPALPRTFFIGLKISNL